MIEGWMLLFVCDTNIRAVTTKRKFAKTNIDIIRIKAYLIAANL